MISFAYVSLWGSPFAVKIFTILHDPCFQKFLDYLKKPFVSYVMRQHLHQPFMVYIIKETSVVVKCFVILGILISS